MKYSICFVAVQPGLIVQAYHAFVEADSQLEAEGKAGRVVLRLKKDNPTWKLTNPDVLSVDSGPILDVDAPLPWKSETASF